jgi:hypothetical protein
VSEGVWHAHYRKILPSMESPINRARRRKAIRRAASAYGWDLERGRQHLAEFHPDEDEDPRRAIHHRAQRVMTRMRKTFGKSFGSGT